MKDLSYGLAGDDALLVYALQESAITQLQATGTHAITMFVSRTMASCLGKNFIEGMGGQMVIDDTLPGIACYTRKGY